MVIRTRSQSKFFAHIISIPELYIEHDDDSESTYLVTPSPLCQNPSHAHHCSHHHSSYRYPVADTVVEESTGGSIVTVISNTASIRVNDLTPDIVLTNSESESGIHIDETLSTATRSLSIHNKLQNKRNDTIESSALSTSPSSSSIETTTAQATEQNLNNNEAGTDSIQNQYVFYTNNCKHTFTYKDLGLIKGHAIILYSNSVLLTDNLMKHFNSNDIHTFKK